MKKIFLSLIALVAFVALANTAYAQGNTATEEAKFTIQVVTPLGIEADGDGIMDLGYITPGQTKTLGAEKSLVFAITGQPGLEFSITKTEDVTAQNGNVTLTGVTWQVQNTGDWTTPTTITGSDAYNSNLSTGDTGGNAWVRVYPTSVNASTAATAESLEFEFTLTCSYTYL